MSVEKKFLKYVSYWTTSEDDKDCTPSTQRQFFGNVWKPKRMKLFIGS